MGSGIDTPIGTITKHHFSPSHVSHQIVLGPKFVFALFDPDDEMHPVSRALLTFIRDDDLPYRRLVVNEHIVDEAATRLKKKASQRYARKFLETLDASNLYRNESVPRAVFEDATERFVEWTDLDASFTDFVVASHMDHLGIDHIATYDSHYDAFDVTTLPYRE